MLDRIITRAAETTLERRDETEYERQGAELAHLVRVKEAIRALLDAEDAAGWEYAGVGGTRMWVLQDLLVEEMERERVTPEEADGVLAWVRGELCFETWARAA